MFFLRGFEDGVNVDLNFKSLGKGFFDGFTGIVTDPIRGAADDGAVGFAKGFVTGTLGILSSPAQVSQLPNFTPKIVWQLPSNARLRRISSFGCVQEHKLN